MLLEQGRVDTLLDDGRVVTTNYLSYSNKLEQLDLLVYSTKFKTRDMELQWRLSDNAPVTPGLTTTPGTTTKQC